MAEEDVRKLLETFVVDNADLERLESLANQFNIFEAVGPVGQELRHSYFLAYLLNPQQNHGLKDVFVKRLLQRTVAATKKTNLPVTPIELDIWNLEGLEVSREWQNIDILLLDEANNLVVVVENKIGTGEHSDQLERYWQILRQHHPTKRILGIYLTPDGEEPSHESFLSLDYGQIATLIEDLVVNRTSILNPEVRTLLLHYAQMLRRHIVSESEIAELCRLIYKKHQQALDLIFDHRPDELASRGEFLRSLIASRPDLVEDFSTKNYVRFTLKKLDSQKLKSGQGWTRSGRVLLFEFQNFEDSLKLKLQIGPGPHEVREKVFQLALNNQPLFKPQSKSLNKQWNEVFNRDFLSSKSFHDLSEEDIEAKIREQWEQFLSNEMQAIAKLIEGVKWLFEG
ncbi:MAG TPA: PD-(D/E)XK nuclease family protein [Syntrophobacteraceae bacterium]|nr:PD-(D/E)XK nuclease family protein [Syntrophobacteraceae bacterium]